MHAENVFLKPATSTRIGFKRANRNICVVTARVCIRRASNLRRKQRGIINIVSIWALYIRARTFYYL